MKNTEKLKEMFKRTQEQLTKIEVIGEAGAGAVKITMDAQHICKNVEIDPEILKEPKAILEGLLVAAINNGAKKIEDIAKATMFATGKNFESVLSDEQ